MINEKKVVKLDTEEFTDITVHDPHRVLLAGVGEDSKVKTEISDGKYVIFQSGQGRITPFPVFAFEVDYGNFRIRSIYGSNDISNLASQVWHLRFKDRKEKTALKLLNKLKKELSIIETELDQRIKYRNK